MEFDRVDLVHIAAVGEPGARTFFFQARRDLDLVTLLIEKDDAVRLAQTAHQLLLELQKQDVLQTAVERDPPDNPAFEEDEPRWRVGEIAVGYDSQTERFLIECKERVPLSDPDEVLEFDMDLDAEEKETARFWLTAEQLATLGIQALVVASQGRPICPLCRMPIDPEGHECAGTNGHRDSIEL